MPLVGNWSNRSSNRFACVVFSSVAIAFGAGSWANDARVDWIYSVEVPVASTASSDVMGAASTALAGILLRVTGLPRLPKSAEIAAALQNVEGYYTRTSYVNRTLDDGSEMPQRHVVFEFDPTAIQELLRRARLPVWTIVRPEVVVWLILEEGDMRRLSSPALNPELTNAVRFRARERGLPIQLPLGDISDLKQGIPELVSARMWVAVEQASKRYRGDTIAVFQFVRDSSGGSCLGAGMVSLGGEVYEFEFEGAHLKHCGISAMDGLVDRIASWYAVPNQESKVLRVDVGGISTPKAYAELLDYLRSWEVVYRVEVAKVRGDVLSLRVESVASASQFLRLLTEEGVLGRSAGMNALPEREALRLHWLGTR